MCLLWSESRRYHGISQSSTCRVKVLDGQLQTLSESEANESGGSWVLFWEVLACGVQSHIQVVHVLQFSYEIMSTCARRNYGWGEEKSWRDWPNLSETYATHRDTSTQLCNLPWNHGAKPHDAQLRFTVRDGHGTELMLRRVGVGEVPWSWRLGIWGFPNHGLTPTKNDHDLGWRLGKPTI